MLKEEKYRESFSCLGEEFKGDLPYIFFPRNSLALILVNVICNFFFFNQLFL